MNQVVNRLSVAMCTFNGGRYLQEQLDSIASQTRPPDEFVICDDCSSDETITIIENFARHSSFPVHLHLNDRNLGSTRNFEKATGLCSGEIIAFADQDDVWKPEKLRLLEAEFAKRPDVGLVFSDAEIVDEKLHPVGHRMWNEVGFGERERQLIRNGRALDVLLPGWTVTGATMAFRSKFRDLILPIPTSLPMIHDGWIALIVAAVAEVEFIDQPLILYRQHSEQQIGAPVGRVNGKTGVPLVEVIQRAANQQNSYSELTAIIDVVSQRLGRADNLMVPRETLADLESRRGHLRARGELPATLMGRFAVVLKELTSGRYHRYANGFASAAKDLVKGDRGAN